MGKKTALCRYCSAKTKVEETRAALVACAACGQMLHNPWRLEHETSAKPPAREPRWMRILFWVFPTRVKMGFGITLAELLLGAGVCLALSAFVIQRFDLMS